MVESKPAPPRRHPTALSFEMIIRFLKEHAGFSVRMRHTFPETPGWQLMPVPTASAADGELAQSGNRLFYADRRLARLSGITREFLSKRDRRSVH